MAEQFPTSFHWHTYQIPTGSTPYAVGAGINSLIVPTGSFTGGIQLPALSSVPDGFWIRVTNLSSSPVTVNVAVGSTDIFNGGTTSNSVAATSTASYMAVKFAPLATGTPVVYQWLRTGLTSN